MTDFDTLAVHAGEEADSTTGALRLPLHMATTFKLPPFGGKLFDDFHASRVLPHRAAASKNKSVTRRKPKRTRDMVSPLRCGARWRKAAILGSTWGRKD